MIHNELSEMFVLKPLVVAGYASFMATKRTPWLSYRAMRKLYYTTQGRFHDQVTRALRHLAPPRDFEIESGLCAGTQAQADALAALRTDGFYVFPGRLAKERVDRLLELATRTKARLVPQPADGPAVAVLDRANPRAPRYQFSESDLLAAPEVQRLVADESLMALAQAYLGVAPVNDLVTMWCSVRLGAAASSEAAQLFHYDLDRFRF